MKIDFKSEYKLTVRDMVFFFMLSMIVGAIVWIFAPVLIFTQIVAVVAYVGVNLYYGIKERSNPVKKT